MRCFPHIAREERRLIRLQKQLAAVKRRITGEPGSGPRSKSGAMLLFGLILPRCGRGSMIRVGELPFDGWTETVTLDRIGGKATSAFGF